MDCFAVDTAEKLQAGFLVPVWPLSWNVSMKWELGFGNEEGSGTGNWGHSSSGKHGLWLYRGSLPERSEWGCLWASNPPGLFAGVACG